VRNSCPSQLEGLGYLLAVSGCCEGVQGCLSAATRGRATGWAWEPGVEERLELSLLVDGKQVASKTAATFREGLRAAGIGDGACAFSIALPEFLRDGMSHTIAVVAPASGTSLGVGEDFVGESPPGDRWHPTQFTPGQFDQVTAAIAAPIAEEVIDDLGSGTGVSGLRGCLEAVVDGRAFGWAQDPGSPRRRLALSILVDGEPVAETVADLLRPSLLREGIGDGRHGFLVVLPSHLRDGLAHTIAVLLPDGEQLPFSHAFATTVERAVEWGETSFLAHSEQAQRPVGATAVATRTRHLRPLEALELSRSPSRGRFSCSFHSETVVLASEMDVELAELRQFAVQPGVADPLAEHQMRSDAPRSYSVPRLLASRLPQAIVDTTSFLVMPTEHEYMLDSLRHPGAVGRWGYERLPGGGLRCEIGEVPEREERVVALGAQSNSNYSHWLLESLVRALLFRPLDDGSWLYLTPPLRDWQRQTLELVGIERERILEVEPDGPVRFREVASVSRGMGGLPAIRPAGVSALADLATPSSEQRRIYCSRIRARHRHASNELALIELLAGYGFESVSPETLTIAEQISLFAGAEVVCALHGSALTNIAFCPPGTLVVELQAEGFNQGGVVWNWILASLRDQPFVQVVCPLADPNSDLPHASRDVAVDLAHLDAVLNSALPER